MTPYSGLLYPCIYIHYICLYCLLHEGKVLYAHREDPAGDIIVSFSISCSWSAGGCGAGRVTVGIIVQELFFLIAHFQTLPPNMLLFFHFKAFSPDKTHQFREGAIASVTIEISLMYAYCIHSGNQIQAGGKQLVEPAIRV